MGNSAIGNDYASVGRALGGKNPQSFLRDRALEIAAFGKLSKKLDDCISDQNIANLH